MTGAALILVTDPQRSLKDHAGLPLLKRTVLSAQKGGIRNFIIAAPKNSEERLRTLLAGDNRITSTIHWNGHEDGNLQELLKATSSESIMIIKAETVFDSNVIKKMRHPDPNNTAARVAVRNGPEEAGQRVLRLDGGAVVECNVPTASHQTAGLVLAGPNALENVVARAGNYRPDLCGIIEGLLSAGTLEAVDVTDDMCMEITSQETMRESEEKLFGRLGLATDSPFSTHVSRKLSRLVTGVLVRLPLTPNQITLFSFSISLVACLFYFYGGYGYSVLGAVTLYVAILFDLADGEVARLKFMSSKYGALLDSICDSIIHSGVLFCIALAIHRNGHIPNIIAIGAAAAVAMFVCTNLDTYIHLAEKDLWNNQPSPLERLFANEDCFYLSLLGFTVLDRLPIYLWIVAIGATVYTFVMLGEMTIKALSSKKVQ